MGLWISITHKDVVTTDVIIKVVVLFEVIEVITLKYREMSQCLIENVIICFLLGVGVSEKDLSKGFFTRSSILMSKNVGNQWNRVKKRKNYVLLLKEDWSLTQN